MIRNDLNGVKFLARSKATMENADHPAARTQRMALAAVVLSFAVGAISLSIAQQEKSPPPGKDNSVYAELAKAPKKAIARHNPMEADPEAVAAGGKLFERHCAECHGDTAEGGKKGPSLRAEPVQQATPGTLFWVLTNGVVRRGMPVWSKLPEPQRWQLVTYIKSLTPAPKSKAGEEKPPANEDKAKPPGD